MVVLVEWDRRHRLGAIHRTRTVARGDWLGGLGALALYNNQNDALYRSRELET